MIYLNKNGINNVFVTASEMAPTGHTYFNFLLENCETHVLTQFASTNLSTSERYDQFQIIETGKTSVNLSASTVNLDAGTYLYKIYANSVTGITAQTIVENGLLEVITNDALSAQTYNTYLTTSAQTYSFLGNL